MKLTTRGRYAVTAILDVAIHSEEGPVNLADISERQGISVSYLEQLFAKLRRSELVSSTRGPGGGYRLGHDSGDIYVAQVVDAVDENVDVTRCRGQGNCQGGETCLTHELWMDLSEQIHQLLNGISLRDLVDRAGIREVALRQDDSQRARRERLDKNAVTNNIVLDAGS